MQTFSNYTGCVLYADDVVLLAHALNFMQVMLANCYLRRFLR